MNKNEYIKAVNNITAPKSLIEKIEALETVEKKKKSVFKTVVAVAACFVAVTIAFSGIVGGTLMASEGDMAYNNLSTSLSYGATAGAPPSVSVDASTSNTGSAVVTDRKIVKNAALSIKTKSYDTLLADVKQKIEQYGGYIEESQEYNFDSGSNRSVDMDVKIPADKLEKFIEEISLVGTVTSKTVSSDDITDSYIDVESRIKALETEEKTLLGILEKAESLTDVIELQKRLSTVRTDLEAMKVKKQSYDNMVAYSEVFLDINEVERVVEGDETFLGEVKEKLMNNLYDLGDFLRELAINLIASSPYLIILGAVAAIVFVIVKKRRKNKL